MLRVKTTYYAKIKNQWKTKIKNRRQSCAEAVRTSISRSERTKYTIANMVRNISQLNALEKRMKDESEKRVKTAQVTNIRSLLRTGNESAKFSVYQRNVKSAMHARVYSAY